MLNLSKIPELAIQSSGNLLSWGGCFPAEDLKLLDQAFLKNMRVRAEEKGITEKKQEKRKNSS